MGWWGGGGKKPSIGGLGFRMMRARITIKDGTTNWRSPMTAIELMGEVIEADVRKKQFQLSSEPGHQITINFNEDQESNITSALRDHHHVWINLKGRGMKSPQGDVIAVQEIDEIKLVGAPRNPSSTKSERFGNAFDRISKEIPEEVWRGLPTDLSENHDYYLYELAD
jgi:hypothetical protein